MEKNQENKLLFLIKFVPIIIILAFTIVNIILSIQQNETEYKKTISTLHTELMNKAKQRAQDEVLDVYELIKYKKSVTQEKLKALIKERVYEAHTIMTRIYNENKTKSKNEIIKLIQDALRDIRFLHGRGYFFVYKMDGEVKLLPPAPHLEGKSLWNFKDAKGVYTIREMSQLVQKNNEGFYSWHWYKPEDKTTQYKKLGYGKYFAPLDLFVGTGEYIKDFEKDLQEEVLERINSIRYGKNGYIFLYQYDGLTLAHLKKERLGTNRYNVQDKKGYFRVQGIINGAKEGGKFIEYVGSVRPTTGKPAQKISYVKGFDEWQWAIGTGVYLNDIDDLIKTKTAELQSGNSDEIQRILLINISLATIFIFIAFILANRIQKIFLSYKEQMDKNYSTIYEQSKMVSMGEMIGNIAHQWRQPLSIISTASTGILFHKEMGSLNDKLIEEEMNMINDNAQYLSKTIDDFRDFIKGEKKFGDVKVKDLLDSTLNIVSPALKNNYINLEMDVDDSLVIFGSKNELEQVLINILNNAKDAIKDKDIENGNIKIFTEVLNKESFSINIIDNGGGIPEDIISNIFEPYYTTKHQSVGTGLGLSMVDQIIRDRHGQNITVENQEFEIDGELYKGACFSIIFSK